jgi:exo-beta-1,3-glucanase (GH17 family)
MKRLLLFFALAALLNGAAWWWPNQPREAGPDIHNLLSSASFAPFRAHQSPLTKTFPSAAEIEEDLVRLKGVARGIRTYTSREGMDVVPALARKHGFKLIHSAWLTSDKTPEGQAVNAGEVRALIEQANAFPDAVERVIVGNEVLLRRDLPPQKLISYIRQVKSQVRQPVSYADVWAFWLKHPEVAREVDFITIHILPYWEDEPVGVAGVGAHFEAIHRQMRQAFPGKPILIGEAGWPTQGRNRGPASTGAVNAAKHLRALAETAQKNGFDYNVVEAFDQVWKAKHEGTVGGKWGLLDESRRLKYPLAGPVVENPQWPWLALASALIGLALLLGMRKNLHGLGWRESAAFAGLTQLFAASLAVFSTVAGSTSFSLWHDAYYLLAGLGLLGLVWIGLHHAAGILAGTPWLDSRLPPLFFLAASLAFVQSIGLIFDGRYRDNPSPVFFIPVILILALALIGRWKKGPGVAILSPLGEPRRNLLAGRVFLLAAILNVLAEGYALYAGEDFTRMHPDVSQQLPLLGAYMVSNAEVFLWSAMLLALGLPFWLASRRHS